MGINTLDDLAQFQKVILPMLIEADKMTLSLKPLQQYVQIANLQIWNTIYEAMLPYYLKEMVLSTLIKYT